MPQKTPGVYIVEKNAFPNSVLEVATAVPAFVGHTERASDKGNTLSGKPWRITSLSDYVEYFGREPDSRFALKPSDTTLGDFSIPAPGASPARKDYLVERIGPAYSLYACMQLFFQNGGGPCYIVSVGDYTQELSAERLQNGIIQLKKEQEPTLVVVPEAVMLDQEAGCIAVQQAVLRHCGVDMKNRFAILDVYEGYRSRSDMSDPIERFRDGIGTNSLEFAAAYYPWLETSIVKESNLSYLNIDADSAHLLKVLLQADMKLGEDQNEDEKVRALAFMDDNWLVAKEVDGKYVLLGTDEFAQAQTADDKSAFKTHDEMKTKLPTPDQLDEAQAMIDQARFAVHQLLAKSSAVYNRILRTMALKLNRLPPSAAIAGLYTRVDNAHSVWKAPANASLNAVIGPSVSVSHEEQEDLNVTAGGKSVNAIRSFIGDGVLVWGARTLDGISLDWRYVNVRRTAIMLEESLRRALAAYGFAPNTADTWGTVKGMATDFLTSIWKRGGLAGASPDEAFSVQVGLGQTMTAEDILEGHMNVRVLVAPSWPAEFIEITIQQGMQKS